MVTDRKPIPLNDLMFLGNLMNHFIKEKFHISIVFNTFESFTDLRTIEDVIRVEILDEIN